MTYTPDIAQAILEFSRAPGFWAYRKHLDMLVVCLVTSVAGGH